MPLVAVALAVSAVGLRADAKVPPLYDPAFLNIGFVCQWQESCMNKQKKAMKRAIAYTDKTDPPNWKMRLCNRRAVQRRSGRTDWLSYYNCIRSPAQQPSATTSRGGR